jgi:hypothetical protein
MLPDNSMQWTTLRAAAETALSAFAGIGAPYDGI